jgi:hypothetical protein
VAPSSRTNTSTTTTRARISTRSIETIALVPPSMTRLTARKNGPFGLSVPLRSSAESAGVSVSALNAEISIDTAIVNANC